MKKNLLFSKAVLSVFMMIGIAIAGFSRGGVEVGANASTLPFADNKLNPTAFASPVTLYESDGTTVKSTHTTIQAAITAASAGDVIFVDAGTYTETININKSLTLRGPNVGIDPSTGTRVAEAILENAGITVNTLNTTVTIDGFKISNPGNYHGINMSTGNASSVTATIQNNIFERYATTAGQNAHGIYLSSSSKPKIIKNNLFTGSTTYSTTSSHKTWRAGVWYNGGDVTIQDNVFERCNTILNLEGSLASIGDVSGNTFRQSGTAIGLGAQPVGTFSLGKNYFVNPISTFGNCSGCAVGFRLDMTQSVINGKETKDYTINDFFISEQALYHLGRVSNSTARNGLIMYKENSLFARYSTIQNAIANAQPGDTIFVYNANWTEKVVVDKDNLTFYGRKYDESVTSRNSPTATAETRMTPSAGNDIAFTTSGTINKLTIKGFSFQGGSGNNSRQGIVPASIVTDLTVENNLFNTYNTATKESFKPYEGSQNVVFKNNRYFNSQKGVNYPNGVSGSIQNNIIPGVTNGVAVRLGGSDNDVDISNNDMSGAGIGVQVLNAGGADNLGTTAVHDNNLSGKGTYFDNARSVALANYCNWFNDTDPGSINTKVSGNALVASYLTIGNNNASVGFDPDAGVCYYPVNNVTQTKGYLSIQAAIDDAIAGDEISVEPGVYAEDLIIDKSVSLLGPNVGVDPCSGSRMDEAVIIPATGSNGSVIDVTASDITINGFTIDGDNPNLVTGYPGVGASLDPDVYSAVTRYDPGNNLIVINNIVRNTAYSGIELYDYPAGNSSSGNIVSNNKIQDLGTYDVGWAPYNNFGVGVLIYNNQYTQITENCMDNVRIGIQTGNFSKANPGAANYQNISDNVINARKSGIFHNLQYSNASPFTLSNNTIIAIDDVNETKWDGIALSSLQGVPAIATDNNIDGSGFSKANKTVGYSVWNVSVPITNTTITGGTIEGVDYGVFANNFEGYSQNAPEGAHATISGLTISTNDGGIGVYAFDSHQSTSHASVKVSVTNCNINGGYQGVALYENVPGTVGGTIINNTIEADWAGINISEGMIVSAANPLVIEENNITMTAQLTPDAAELPTGGIVLRHISGDAPTVKNNHINGAFGGIGVYDVNTSPVTTIEGGTIKSSMQGVVVVNLDPFNFTDRASSSVVLKDIEMSDFSGDNPVWEDADFHAGVYATSGGSDASATINVTAENLDISGTGNHSPESAAYVVADWSGDVGMLNVAINESNIHDNLNRGIYTRGGGASVAVNRSTFTNNGFDPHGIGFNDGYGIAVREGAALTALNNFITNPTTVAGGYNVYALFTDGAGAGTASLTAHNNWLSNNGNADGKLAFNLGDNGVWDASCNWWGANICMDDTDYFVGTVNNTTLNNDTDDDAITAGFQPVAGACDAIPFVANTSISAETCNGLGSVTVSLTGGTAPFNITWTGGGSASNVSSPYDIADLAAGTYSINVTDNCGATAVVTAIVENHLVTNTTTGVTYATIQDAINAADDNQEIVVCSGTLDLTSNISINKAITLTGANAGICYDGTRVSETEIQINGNYKITVGNTAGVTIDGFKFKVIGGTPVNYSIINTTSGPATIKNNIFDGNNQHNVSGTTYRSAIFSQGATGAPKIYECNVATGFQTAVLVDGNNAGVTIQNSRIANNFSSGVQIGASLAGGVQILNNEFESNVPGIVMPNANNLVDGNIFKGSSYGILMWPGANLHDNQIINNTFDYATGPGIYVYDFTTNPNVNNGNVVTGNTFKGNMTNYVYNRTDGFRLDVFDNTFEIDENLVETKDMDFDQLYQLENRMSHMVDNSRPTNDAGFTRLRPNHVYVSTSSNSIQRAVDAALPGDTIYVQNGTYDEQVVINKSVTIIGTGTTKPVVNFTGTVTGRPALFDVTADGVVIENMDFLVDMSKLRSAVIASAPGIDAFTFNGNDITGHGTPGGSYGDRNAVSVNYAGTENYRVASGGVDNVYFNNNTVSGTQADGAFFRAGIAVDEGRLTAKENTLQTINHDIITRFNSSGQVEIRDNQFNGGGVEVVDLNAGSGQVTITGNNFDGTAAKILSPNTGLLRLKNNQNGIAFEIFDNTFTDFEWAVSLENMKNITLDNNSFTTTEANAHAVVVNTKSISSNSNTIVQTTIDGTFINNQFNGTGTALMFANHDNDNASFGTFTIGQAGKENSFGSSLTNFIVLDAQTGISSGSIFPTYPGTGGWNTTMACWNTNLNAENNKFDVGSGLILPTALDLSGRTTLESKLVHQPDNSCLGVIQFFMPVHNIDQNTYYVSIQEAVNDAQEDETLELSEWTYNENVVVDKSLTIQGLVSADKADIILDGTGLSNGSAIFINNSVENVTIQNLTIQNYKGNNGNSHAGIYGNRNNDGLNVNNVSVKNNTNMSGFYANGPVDGITVNGSSFVNNSSGARGIVIWNGFKQNVTITNNYLEGNNCCGIELQDGTASGVTIAGNTIKGMDSALGLVGLKAGAGPNIISNNTIEVNGRFGIEIKNPDGTGNDDDSEDGAIIVASNTVTFKGTTDLRDLAGISVYRRGVLASENNVDIPTGVVIKNNTVSDFNQTSNSTGFGIVIEGLNHTVKDNDTGTGNDVAIQVQAGHTPYPEDGDQNNLDDDYFGRGNSPITCAFQIKDNSGVVNYVGVDPNIGHVINQNTGKVFCSIQSAIDAASTVDGDVIEVSAGTYNEKVDVTKSLIILGPNADTDCNAGRVGEAIIVGTGGDGFGALNIMADDVTVNGFTIKNPMGDFGVAASGKSGAVVKFNVITDVGNNVNGWGPSQGINFNVTANALNASFTDNCIFDIRGGQDGCPNTFNGSASGIAITETSSTATLTGLNIERNRIYNISACNFNGSGGKGAYGVLINTGASSSGSVSNANISFNDINDLSGRWVHAIGLEGKTPNASVKNNDIKDLSAIAGDAIAVFFEDNNGVASSVVNENSFTGTFTLGVAVHPSLTGQLDATGNWWGTDDTDDISGLVSAGSGSTINYVPFLTNGTSDPLVDPGFKSEGDLWGPVSVWRGGVKVSVHATIQAGVDAAINGDIVMVSEGTYNENVSINKEITLNGALSGVDAKGRTADESIVVGKFTVRADNVTIDGFTVSPSSGEAININVATTFYSGETIINNIFNTSGGGININSNNTVISKNKFNMTSGYAITYSNNPWDEILISENEFVGSSNSYDINFIGAKSFEEPDPMSKNVTVTSNISSSKGNFVVAAFVDNLTISQNTITSDKTSTQLAIMGGNKNVQITNNLLGGMGTGVNVYQYKDSGHPTWPSWPANDGVEIHNNSFSGSTGKAILLSSGALVESTLDATCNWYGTANGNTITDTKVAANVDIESWLTSGGNSASVGFTPTGDCDGTFIVVGTPTTNPENCVADGSIEISWTGGSADYTVSWTGAASGSDDEISSGSHTITGLVAGTYNITITDTYGTNSSVSGIIVTHVAPGKADALSKQATICEGSSVEISAACSVGTVVWSNGATGIKISVSPVVTTVYTAKCVVDTCEGAISDEIEVVVMPKPITPVIVASSSVVCQDNNTVELSTSTTCDNGVLHWSVGDDAPFTTGASVIVSPTATTTYKVFCKPNEVLLCESDRGQVTITVNTNNLTAPTTTPANVVISERATTTLTASCTTGTPVWFDQMGTVVHVDSPFTTPSIEVNTSYTVKCVSDPNNLDDCMSAGVTQSVNIDKFEIVNQPSHIFVCNGQNAWFTVGATGRDVSYQWQEFDGTNWYNLANGGIYSGVNTSHMNITVADKSRMDLFKYRVLVTNKATDAQDPKVLTSNAVVLSITNAALAYNVNMVSPLIGVTNIYQAVQTIVASNIIDGGNIKYFAGNAITFEPGFEVKEGTVFEAKIQVPCTNTSAPSKLPDSITK